MSSLRDTVARALAAYFENDADAYETWLVEAAVALAAIREQYAIVPREATMEMLDAVLDWNRKLSTPTLQIGYEYNGAEEIYRAMIAVGEVKE